jgi:hypothetical protein
LHDLAATRRGLLIAPLRAALLADHAHAIDRAQTQVTLPDQMQWNPWSAGGDPLRMAACARGLRSFQWVAA